MFLLQRNCKVSIILLYIVFILTLTSCSSRSMESNNIIENTSGTNKLIVNAMLIYTAESSSDLSAQITNNLPQDVGVAFYSTEQNYNILFYVEDSNEPAVVWINGEKYPFHTV